MTINVLSDIHCLGVEMPASFDVGSLKSSDVLVVAGDIGIRDTVDELIEKIKIKTENKFKKIVFIRGNHDFYSIKYYYNDIISPSEKDNFVINVDADKKVDFICTTLWSPIKNNDIIKSSLNDYNYIPEFTTQTSTELFWKNLEWLEKSVAKSKAEGRTVVVVTHHIPRHELIDDEFKGDALNEAFCVVDTEAEERLNALSPALWIHGHSHKFMDKTIDGTRYVRNPYGYEQGLWKENTGYRHNFIVEI